MKYNWYTYYNVYTPDECKRIYQHFAQNHTDYHKDRGAISKRVNTLVCETNIIEKEIEKFFQHVEVANEEFFGFDLFCRPRTVNLNVYDEGMEYPKHIDAMSLGSANDIKLTAILNLSQEPYVGGDFIISCDEDICIDEMHNTGHLIVFPSFLYHRVKPVTSGKRLTLSAWFTGPNWK